MEDERTELETKGLLCQDRCSREEVEGWGWQDETEVHFGQCLPSIASL